MAAASDPLDALIATLSSRQLPQLLDAASQPVTALKDAVSIALPGSKGTSTFPRATTTRYRRPTAAPDATDAAAFYDLQSLVLLYLFKDRPVAEYIQEVQATAGVTAISVLHRGAVLELLEQTREAGDEVRQGGAQALAPVTTNAADELVSPRPAKKARYTVNREDLELCRKYMAMHDAKQLNDRERVLRGQKPNNFSAVTTVLASRIKEATEDVRRLSKSGSSAAASHAAKPVADASSQRRKQQAPIIIVSPSSSALISMYNVKRFLEEGVFETSEQARIEAGARANDIVTVNHKRQVGSHSAGATVLASGGSTAGERVVKYVVVDGAEALLKLGGESAWDRVCCVMTTGQEWQFRPYKYQEPRELFSRVKGVSFTWTSSPPDPKIKGWNVAEFKIDPTKRHLDKSCVSEFWRQLEEWLRGRPHLASGL